MAGDIKKAVIQRMHGDVYCVLLKQEKDVQCQFGQHPGIHLCTHNKLNAQLITVLIDKVLAMNKIHEFTLVLEGVNDNTPHLEDRLFEAGCSDALINFRNGTVYLDFSRQEQSFEAAIFSAIHAVENCGLDIKVIRILPDDLVSISDIAKRLNTDRQRVSQWVKGERRQHGKPFPPAILKLSEKSPLWRWYSVVQWLYDQKIIQDIKIIDNAKFIENLNVVLDERNSDLRKYRDEVLEKLKDFKESQEGHVHTNSRF